MSRRFEPRHDKVINTAAIAPVMPDDPKPKPDQVVKKIYIQQQPKAGELYGVPKLALTIILVNCVIWICGVTSLFVGKSPAADIAGLVILLIVALTITIGLYFAIWKMYWWLLAFSASIGTLALLYVIIAITTGRMTLNNINFPGFRF